MNPAQQIKYKRAALAYAHAHQLPVPRGYAASFPGVRTPARTLFWTIEHHAGYKPTGTLTTKLQHLLIPPVEPAGPVYGVDVSNHQPNVAWPAVHASGARYAYLKASEGTRFTDAYYSSHRAAANKAGVKIGAYHFARPSTSGTAQAKHFLAVAKPRRGDLLPVIDLEVSDGVGEAGIATWVREFAAAIHRAVGHSPILYTYPAFWRGNMGNTREFSTLPLWIANYGVSHPDIPGGWTSYAIWQFTSSGYLRGVPGRIDRNLAPHGLSALTL